MEWESQRTDSRVSASRLSMIGVTYVTEQTQHLVVRSIIGNEESEVCISEDGSNSDEASSATRHDADVLPGVFAFLALAVVLVVEICNCRTQRLDASGWTVFTTGHAHIDSVRTLKASFNFIVNLGGTLA